MSGPWYAARADSQASGGGESPDPVAIGDPSWTWDVEFNPVSSSLYARASLNTLSIIGGGTAWSGGGIVQYRTRKGDGVDSNHPVGQGGVDGYVDFIWDTHVDSVTFGWIVEGDNFCWSRLNMEIWI
jgi:hypothetical protein